jgi:hypothetical protein
LIVEDIGACFLVKDSNGQKLAAIYYEEEPGRRSTAKMLTRDEARRIAVNLAKLPGAVAELTFDKLRKSNFSFLISGILLGFASN